MNSVIAAAQVALMATGLVLVFLSYPRLFHFAHGATYAIGAYVTFALMDLGVVPPVIAVPLGVLSAVAWGMLVEGGIYRFLRNRQSPAMILLLASLGLFVVAGNAIALLFGDERKRLAWGPIREGTELLGARITPAQLATVCCGVAIPLATWTILRVTRAGIMLRAMGSDPELASAFGVDRDRVMMWGMAAASGMAGLAGILAGYDTGLDPAMGFRAILLAVVAHVVGGGKSILGVLAACLLIAVVGNVSAVIWPTIWQDPIVFGVFVLFLLARPLGLVGHPLGRAGV